MYEPLVELEKLEKDRAALLQQVSQLGDMRRGSITTTSGTCGTLSCHCHHPNDPGHGPTLRLTYKVQGKTVTESLSNAAALFKTQREVAEYHRFRDLGRTLVEVNEKICRLRPVGGEEAPAVPADKKKRRRRSSEKLPKK